jgi:hypothetical protein
MQATRLEVIKVGKQNRITFNVNDLFLEGQNDADTRGKFIRSPLFGIAVNLYNRAKTLKNLDLRVGFIEMGTFLNGEAVIKVNLVTPTGIPVAVISNTNLVYSTIGFHTYSSHTETPEGAYRQLSSSNPKYVQSKVSVKSEHDAAQAFDSALVSAHNFLDNYLRGILDSIVDQISDDRFTGRPLMSTSKLTDEAVTFLAKVYAGKCTFAEMPLDMRALLDHNLKKYDERCDKFNNAIQKSVEFMDSDKWIFIPGMNRGVVMACVSPDGMTEALTKYRDGQYLPNIPAFKYAREVIPCKWYPSFEDIPDDYRKGLEFSMMMLKTHRNSNDLLPKECQGGKFFTEMGCYSQTGWSPGSVDVHILSR